MPINPQEMCLDHINSKIHDHRKLFFNLTRLIGDAFFHFSKERLNCKKEVKSTEDSEGREFNTYIMKVNSATSLYGDTIGQEKTPDSRMKLSRVCTQAQTK
ncbi:unnamed protein product [Rhizophagus irregularis]|nr:unnamed protein product [Rhizophagus irregularis]